nr:LysR substrate-binding domain-containing protein [Sphingomonas sp. UV9]
MYRWEFEGPEGEFSVPVASKILVNGGRAMLAMALAGTGLMYGMEATFAPYIARGDLRLVLEDWATMGPAYHVYYSSRRQVPTGLKLLIELIRELRPLGLQRSGARVDFSSIGSNRDGICIPTLRHVEMREWFDIKIAR